MTQVRCDLIENNDSLDKFRDELLKRCENEGLTEKDIELIKVLNLYDDSTITSFRIKNFKKYTKLSPPSVINYYDKCYTNQGAHIKFPTFFLNLNSKEIEKHFNNLNRNSD